MRAGEPSRLKVLSQIRGYGLAAISCGLALALALDALRTLPPNAALQFDSVNAWHPDVGNQSRKGRPPGRAAIRI